MSAYSSDVRRRRPPWWVLAALAVIGPLVASLVWLQPGAELVKLAFQSGPSVISGPGYTQLATHVRVEPDIAVPVPSAPAAALEVYRPAEPGGRPLPIVLWVHGGGFISGSQEQVGDFATMLAANGYVVASLGYSLAPGATYPIPVRQANTALGYLTENASHFGGDGRRIFVGGDSAGAQIASQLAALVSDPALAGQMRLRPAIASADLRGTVLYCGLYDMSTLKATKFFALRTFLWSYTGRRDWSSYPLLSQLSTVAHVSAAYPPTYLTVGDKDRLQPQAFELAAALRATGVAVTTRFWNGTGSGLGHEYQFNFTKPQARANFEDTLDFLSARAQAAGTP